MAYLYESIGNLPGLSGNSYAKQRQLYEKMGSPMGNYSGSYDQNIWLLNQINNGSALKALQPQAAPTTPTVSPAVTKAQEITNPMTEQVPGGNTETMQSLDAYWSYLNPQARASALEVVQPEILRNYNTANRGITSNLAQTGGGRFGKGWGQTGTLQAQTMQNQEAQVQDFTNQYKQGFKDLWYDPTLESWTKSITTPGANLPITDPATQTWAGFTANNAPGLTSKGLSTTSGTNTINSNPYQYYKPTY